MNLKVWMVSMAAASVAAQSGSSSGTAAPLTPAQITSSPGICTDTKQCVTKFGEGYTCVAVKTTAAGITNAKQCVKGAVCGGNIAGACPTFASWPSKFRVIQPVCAFVEVKNCNAATDGNGNAVVVRSLRESAGKPGNVSCFSTTFQNNDGAKKTVLGIYQCVDKTDYEKENLGYLDFTAKQMQSCAGNVTQSNGQSVTTGLCNAHGTCAPTGMFSADYRCICGKGYSPNDNCFNATSDVCDSFGQCGAGNCDPTNGKCVCPAGTKGPQCNLCDPKFQGEASQICSGHGTCGVDGTCVCTDGYIGDNCGMKPAKPTPTKSNSTDSGSATTSAGARDASIAIFGLATIVAAAML